MGHHEYDTHQNEAEIGVVVDVNSTTIWVERTSLEGCKSCSMNGVCGSSNAARLEFANDDNYQKGDLVDIHVKSSVRLAASFMVFIVPVIFLITAFTISFYWIKLPEPISIGIGFLSLIISILCIILFDRYLGKKQVIQIIKKRI
ncbi:MAG TPA: SoxR reducing system RseC family protein [Candidatus Cloacimonadota bacterium]|jgi:positive regulator of sigma E activity|nr:SoxR reducing system RseC family protein [Candidatus Cloacimonadales bacterium]HPY96466.1 SoxR reducing system RseC family protein [Candidatus Cloacimonadota bacterium]HQB40247.1 SoxR reducing system RseC family protein [Candidatus Cloacimonadota bacterium]